VCGDCKCRSSPLGELTAPQSLDLRGRFKAGKREGKGRNGCGKGMKERNGRDRRKRPRKKFLVRAWQ